MSLGEALAQELAHEAQSTRKHLERIPESKFGYKPHPKSFEMVKLASHIAETPGWAVTTCNLDVFELKMEEWKPFEPSTTKDIVAKFDESIKAACDAIRATPDAKMFAQWTMRMNGKNVIEMPRVAVLRAFVISHMIHHRAQLGMYLRLNDIPVPSAYGPSADEGQMFGG